VFHTKGRQTPHVLHLLYHPDCMIYDCPTSFNRPFATSSLSERRTLSNIPLTCVLTQNCQGKIRRSKSTLDGFFSLQLLAAVGFVGLGFAVTCSCGLRGFRVCSYLQLWASWVYGLQLLAAVGFVGLGFAVTCSCGLRGFRVCSYLQLWASWV
jgi:hypothetical protein